MSCRRQHLVLEKGKASNLGLMILSGIVNMFRITNLYHNFMCNTCLEAGWERYIIERGDNLAEVIQLYGAVFASCYEAVQFRRIHKGINV
jgi:hypothetical protein